MEAERVEKTDEEWRERLSPEQYAVLRQAGTERPFSGEYVDSKEDGTYRCAACGNELFDSGTKFDSGTGWPSFWEAVRPEAVELIEDRAHGMVRTEIRCARCDSHLGHVFRGEHFTAKNTRHCVNSLSIRLEPKA
jgi:peptide-methionine (R)-S-oxide reductase